MTSTAAAKCAKRPRKVDYPIYDSYVEKVLNYFRDVDGFSAFSNEKLKEFLSFKKILLQFRQFYNMGKYNLKDIDRYLWLFGKEKVPKSYKKRGSMTNYIFGQVGLNAHHYW